MSLPFPFFLFIQALHDEYELALLGLAEQLKAQKEKQAKFLKKKLLLKKIAREKELVSACTKLQFPFQLLCNCSTSMGKLKISRLKFTFIYFLLMIIIFILTLLAVDVIFHSISSIVPQMIWSSIISIPVISASSFSTSSLSYSQ